MSDRYNGLMPCKVSIVFCKTSLFAVVVGWHVPFYWYDWSLGVFHFDGTSNSRSNVTGISPKAGCWDLDGIGWAGVLGMFTLGSCEGDLLDHVNFPTTASGSEPLWLCQPSRERTEWA